MQAATEQWQDVWRDGFARVLPVAGLVALRDAILRDSPQLIQGSTSVPPPLAAVQDWACEGACAVSFCGWKGDDGIETVGEVEEFFSRACFEADQLLGEPAACRWFLNFFDDTPRAEMLPKLLAEVELAIASRAG